MPDVQYHVRDNQVCVHESASAACNVKTYNIGNGGRITTDGSWVVVANVDTIRVFEPGNSGDNYTEYNTPEDYELTVVRHVSCDKFFTHNYVFDLIEREWRQHKMVLGATSDAYFYRVGDSAVVCKRGGPGFVVDNFGYVYTISGCVVVRKMGTQHFAYNLLTSQVLGVIDINVHMHYRSGNCFRYITPKPHWAYDCAPCALVTGINMWSVVP